MEVEMKQLERDIEIIEKYKVIYIVNFFFQVIDFVYLNIDLIL